MMIVPKENYNFRFVKIFSTTFKSVNSKRLKRSMFERSVERIDENCRDR